MRLLSLVVLLSCAAPGGMVRAQAPATPESKAPESRAIAFLSASLQNAAGVCPACQQNGEAARALALAAARGHDVGQALTAPLAALQTPAQWPADGTDQALSHLRFAAVLAAAGERDLQPAAPLVAAAKIILADQQPDGSWTPQGDEPGSPLTWGSAVATWMARYALISSGREPDDFAVAQTDRWVRTAEVTSITDAAGVLLNLGVTSDVMADKQRAKYLNLIRFAQKADGGWGAQPNASAGTVFDTALVLLALQQLQADPRLARSTFRAEELTDTIAKARAFLVAQQQADGSWPATVRGNAKPGDADRVATAAWALQALVASGN